MEKSLILEKHNRQRLFAMSMIFIINAVILMSGNDLGPIRLIVGVVMIIISFCYLTFSFIGYSAKSKFAAKILINDQSIELKPSFWKSSLKLNWKDIRNIQLANYSVEFELLDGVRAVDYDTSAEKSIQLKQLLRESAEQHNIQVVGG